MLQRIQTIWLFLASLSLFALLIFPSLNISTSEGIPRSIRATGVYDTIAGVTMKTDEFLPLTIATVVAAFMPLLLIFQYKNRKQQILWCYAAIALIIAYGYWLSRQVQGTAGTTELSIQNFGIGAVLPTLAILFIVMATKAISKDEKLVKSADRLR